MTNATKTNSLLSTITKSFFVLLSVTVTIMAADKPEEIKLKFSEKSFTVYFTIKSNLPQDTLYNIMLKPDHIKKYLHKLNLGIEILHEEKSSNTLRYTYQI